jgi:hypothetical protein
MAFDQRDGLFLEYILGLILLPLYFMYPRGQK